MNDIRQDKGTVGGHWSMSSGDGEKRREWMAKFDGRPCGITIVVNFTDGYSKSYYPAYRIHVSGLVAEYRVESGYIWVPTPQGDEYIPMTNVRDFHVGGELINTP